MFGQIGGQCGIGGVISPNQIGGESFIRHIGNDKLIYDFRSGNGTVVKDRSREGNDGTLGAGAAAPTWVRNGLYFDGGDYVDCGDNVSLDITGKITMEIVFSVTSISAHTHLMGRNLGGSVANYYLYIHGTSKRIYTVVNISDVGKASFSGASSTDIWYHYFGVYDGANLFHYIDAILGSSISATTGAIDNDDVNFSIGAMEDGIDRHLTGYIKSVRVYDKVLSQIEIQQNYLANKFRGNN